MKRSSVAVVAMGVVLVSMSLQHTAYASDLVSEVIYKCTGDPEHKELKQPYFGDVLESEARKGVDDMCRRIYGGSAYDITIIHK